MPRHCTCIESINIQFMLSHMTSTYIPVHTWCSQNLFYQFYHIVLLAHSRKKISTSDGYFMFSFSMNERCSEGNRENITQNINGCLKMDQNVLQFELHNSTAQHFESGKSLWEEREGKERGCCRQI